MSTVAGITIEPGSELEAACRMLKRHASAPSVCVCIYTCMHDCVCVNTCDCLMHACTGVSMCSRSHTTGDNRLLILSSEVSCVRTSNECSAYR